ncbi:response regulator transcription factor [Streptomyces sp. NPDC059002]|uniref:helix-turn-helix transcriptional regulator n=1 Tax=Streptomyces sp. NPDC059002 TaxID=3346690 RepID=UPI00367ED9C0
MQQSVEGGTTTARVRVTVHAADPISRAGALSQLRQCPEIALVDSPRQDGAQVALLLAGTVDESVLLCPYGPRSRPDGVRAVLVVDRIREADLLDVAGCGVAAIVWRREATAPRLLEAVLAAHRGDRDVPVDLSGLLIGGMGGPGQEAPSAPGRAPVGMTSREVDILRLVADGLDTGEIAVKLAYSERTVKKALHNLTSRFQLRNRAHAVAYAMRAGYI